MLRTLGTHYYSLYATMNRHGIVRAVGMAMVGLLLCGSLLSLYNQKGRNGRFYIPRHNDTMSVKSVVDTRPGPIRVYKTQVSNHVRFLFVAALGGTGHHGWHQVLSDGVCERAREAEAAMRDLWFGIDREADENTARLEDALRYTAANTTQPTLFCLNLLGGSMLSYPDQNNRQHHPNVFSLALVAERAGVDLRILVLHRHPAPQLVSLSIHRNYMELAEEAQQMASQGAILNGQLQAIDPRFVACTGFSQVDGQVIRKHVFANMAMADGLKESIERNYRTSVDNIVGAMSDIVAQNGTGITIKLEEMIVYYDYLRYGLCNR
jgi:hypothetical protein